jgi:hypothetical protein
MKRNVHAWWDWTPENQKREWRVSKFGRKWKFQSKVKGDEYWEQHDPLELGVLMQFRDLLYRKYQRRRATYEDFASIDQAVKLRLAKGEKPMGMTAIPEEADER